MSAGRRFAEVIDADVAQGGLPAFVSHGRIIAAYLAEVTGSSAWDIWQSLQLPDALVANITEGTFGRSDWLTEL